MCLSPSSYNYMRSLWKTGSQTIPERSYQSLWQKRIKHKVFTCFILSRLYTHLHNLKGRPELRRAVMKGVGNNWQGQSLYIYRNSGERIPSSETSSNHKRKLRLEKKTFPGQARKCQRIITSINWQVLSRKGQQVKVWGENNVET